MQDHFYFWIIVVVAMGNASPMSCQYPFDWDTIEKSNGTVLPGREGHSAVHYKGSLYYFGGIQDCVPSLNQQRFDGEEEDEYPTACMNDLYQYNIVYH